MWEVKGDSEFLNFTDDEVMQRGRKKIFSTKEKLELVLPSGKRDGFLEKDDLIYLVKKAKINKKDAVQFRVIKFAESPKEATIYSAEEKYFEPYVEHKAGVDGEPDKTEKKSNEKKEINYTIPVVTGIAGGVVAFMIAKKYNKSALKIGVIGALIGVGVGIFIIKQNE